MADDNKSNYLDALRQARDVQIDLEAKLRSGQEFESELATLKKVHAQTADQLEVVSKRYQEQVGVNAQIKKQMNEVYVKLMAGKKGFKIPQEVEEILMKNLQETLKVAGIELKGVAAIGGQEGVSKDLELAKEQEPPKEDEAKGDTFIT